MDDENSLIRLNLLWALICHVFNYFKARENRDNVIDIPKSISILFGAPIGVGKMPQYYFFVGLANILSIIVSLIICFTVDKILGSEVFWYMWIGLVLLISIYYAVRYND